MPKNGKGVRFLFEKHIRYIHQVYEDRTHQQDYLDLNRFSWCKDLAKNVDSRGWKIAQQSPLEILIYRSRHSRKLRYRAGISRSFDRVIQHWRKKKTLRQFPRCCESEKQSSFSRDRKGKQATRWVERIFFDPRFSPFLFFRLTPIRTGRRRLMNPRNNLIVYIPG